jgi:hypothetical protein
MSRNLSGVYSLPAGSVAVDNTIIDPVAFNTMTADLEADANTARPIVAGGTGATTAAAARTNLGATAVGASVFTAADAAAARTAIGVAWTEVGPFNTSSGTAFDVNSIPDGVAEIEIMFDFVSLSGTEAILVQLGALGVGSLDTSGYQSGRITFSGTTIPSPGAISDDSNPGFIVRTGAASNAVAGTMRLVRGANQTLWHYTLVTSLDGATMQIGSGRKYLSASRLDRLRITRNGTNTFDAGFINVRYR